MAKKARLVLEDGTIFSGIGFGVAAPAAGEVVFNTGMVGYPESLTDPSYRGQILVFTYPLIGNYGVPSFERDRWGLPLHFESDSIQVAGIIVAEHTTHFSHFSAERSLDAWLEENSVPGLHGIDTRALTKRLREHGTMLGKIEYPDQETEFSDPNATELVSAVTVREAHKLDTVRHQGTGAPPTVMVVDCGCKTSIIRSLLERGINVVRVPYDNYFLRNDFDGVLISNGPGDPKMCLSTVKTIEHTLAVGKPILGICLGHQLLALAGGAETYKLKFGHRSQNQPCITKLAVDSLHGPHLTSKRAYITSQNHGFAVRADGLPDDWSIWFTNANDGTIEGIRHISKPFWGVQFHPEARPGPVDTSFIFDDFAREIRNRMS